MLLPFGIAGLLVLLPLSYLRRPVITLTIGGLLLVAGILAGVGGFGVLPGLFAIGFGLAAYDVPHTLPTRGRQLLVLVVGGAAFASVGVWLALYAGVPDDAQRRLGLVISLGMSAGYVGLFLLALRTPVGRVLSAVLAPMGRLALTNYVTQALLFVPLGHAFGLVGGRNWSSAAALCVGILVLQAIWSTAWFRTSFGFGPLEWAWRCVTYGKRLPIRRTY